MTTIRTIHLTCPNCQAELETRGFGSTNSFGGKTTDFRGIAMGMSARPFAVHTCTSCGFTGEPDDFDQPVDPELSRRIAAELAPLVGDAPPAAWLRYEYAARIAHWRGDGPLLIADHYLGAAWCLSDEGVEDGEGARYRREAITYFRQALDQEGEVPESQRPLITYLVGELFRRVGEAGTAADWFDRAVATAGDDPDLEWLRKAAHQQKTDPKELFEPAS